jgi:hypothetical protein
MNFDNEIWDLKRFVLVFLLGLCVAMHNECTIRDGQQIFLFLFFFKSFLMYSYGFQ